MSMSYQRADDCLNDALRGVATPHLLLHTGSPGAAGTANIAQVNESNIVRKPVTFGDAPANHPSNTERRVLSTSEVEWTGAQIDAGQNITHFSIWSASSDGQPEFVSTVATAKITGSDGVKVPAGDIEVAISVFAKP